MSQPQRWDWSLKLCGIQSIRCVNAHPAQGAKNWQLSKKCLIGMTDGSWLHEMSVLLSATDIVILETKRRQAQIDMTWLWLKGFYLMFTICHNKKGGCKNAGWGGQPNSHICEVMWVRSESLVSQSRHLTTLFICLLTAKKMCSTCGIPQIAPTVTKSTGVDRSDDWSPQSQEKEDLWGGEEKSFSWQQNNIWSQEIPSHFCLMWAVIFYC